MPDASLSTGRLEAGAIETDLISETIEFIWACLIPWRDDPEREAAEAEEDLNAQFHNFLQSRACKEFPMVFFQLERRQNGRRRVDFSVNPVEAVVIEGVTYTKYNPVLVIEGKRLPTPSRDREREYVSGREKLSGGIQRFKLGLHGKDHQTAIILGYIQQDAPQEWRSRINGWISDLVESHPLEWLNHELLSELESSEGEARSRCQSIHPRAAACNHSDIRIFHLWIQCSRPS